MVDTSIYRKKSRALSILCTIFIAGGILLILLLIILRTPIPPFPEGGGGAGNGIELNLGFTDAGMGNNPQQLSMAEETPKTVSGSKDEDVLTQDVEEASAINEVKKNKKPKKEPVITETEKPVKKVTEKPREVNTRALYPAHNNQTSSEGNQNKSGDQGNPAGSLGAKAFGNGGSGGSGGGTGGGVGTGTGTGVGPGITFDLKDRVKLSLPVPAYKGQSEGVVVVEVVVDKDGQVTQATAGKKGTTTTDNRLWDAAESAARQAKFDRKPDAPAFQKGTITYRFRLQ